MSVPNVRRSVFAVSLTVVLAAAGLMVSAQAPQPVGTWTGVGPINGLADAAASVALADGRTLLVGGLVGDGVASDAVLVYDPTTNVVSAAGQLLAARVGHTATLLHDGRVLVAGGMVNGELSADLELFDPALGTSTMAGTLAQGRSGHAAARLPNGGVLILGGATAAASASADGEVFDPATGHTTMLSSTLAEPRVAASATTLIDGRVLVAGGRNESGDLATAEVFEAYSQTFTPADTTLSVARSGHAAVLLPHNNGVLIAGGSSAGHAVSAADLFLPAQFPDPYFYGMGSFVPAESLGASRTGAAGGPGHADGYAVVAGGGAADGERYRFATIKTDKDDYAPGERAVITGSGWQPGAVVTLLFQEDPAVHDDYVLQVTANEAGNIYWDQWAPEEHDLDVRFYLLASDSRSRAQVTFTDGIAGASAPMYFAVTGGTTCTTTSLTSSVVGTPICATSAVDVNNGVSTGPNFVVVHWFRPSNATAAAFTQRFPSSGTFARNGDTSIASIQTPDEPGAWTVKVCKDTNTCTGQDLFALSSIQIAGGATRLAITSVNDGNNPTFGAPFSVVIQSQNTAGVATNVLAATGVSLSVATGTGVIGGTLSGTIPAGSSSVTLTGVSYSKADNSVSLTATRTSGDSLTPGTSALFNVLKADTFTTVTCAAGPHTYTSAPIDVCTALVTGPGLNEWLAVSYDDNVNAGLVTASAAYSESANHLGSSDAKNFTIHKAPTTTTVTCDAGPYTYNGSEIKPCTAAVSGPGLAASLDVSYADNVNAGTATASASSVESENHLGSSDSKNFTIDKAPTTTTVTCDAGPYTYNGSEIKPCTAEVSGPGVSQALTVNYTDNVNAGTATASASYTESENHFGSSDSKNFTIDKAPTTTTVTCGAGPFIYNGSAIEPCTASASGAGGLYQSLTVNYTNNVNAGTATASASYTESENHFASSDSKNFTIEKAPQAITFTSTPPDPFTLGSTYAASATGGGSGNPVVFNSPNPSVCSVAGNVVTSLTIGSCVIAANQAGNANYHAADQVTQTFGTHFAFTGFFRPVDNLPVLNSVKAGSAVPLKFSLNGYQGMDIFAPNYPVSGVVSCDAQNGIDEVTETLTAGHSSLSYDATADQYVYVWKTEKNWSNCRLLVVRLKDGKEYRANFLFKK